MSPNAALKQLKNKLNLDLKDFEHKLNQLKFNLNNATDYINEECRELRRLVQLNAEEAIAEVKQLNGFDINSEITDLNAETQAIIENLNRASDLSFNKIDQYELETTESFKEINQSNKIHRDIEQLKNSIADLDKQTLATNLNSKKLRNLNRKLVQLDSRLFIVTLKSKALIFNNNLMEFKQIEQNQLGYINLKQSIDFSKLTRTKLQIITEGSHFEIFSNKTYLIAFKLDSKMTKTVLINYDQFGSEIVKRIVLNDMIIHRLKIVNNLVVLLCVQRETNFFSKMVLIMNDRMETICKKVVGNIDLIGANESQLIFNDSFKLKMFDWTLKETNESFNLEIDLHQENIQQFEILKENFCLRTNNSFIRLYNKQGSLVRTIEADDSFVIDSNDNIIVLNISDRALKYFTSNGEPFKEKRIDILKDLSNLKFRIDKNDRLYFYFDQMTSFVYL